jgi:phenylpyruvate tautomerase PptA (4-oxalocrotonate tautomerase family)
LGARHSVRRSPHEAFINLTGEKDASLENLPHREEKAELADRVAKIVYPHLPAFYVGVVFQEVSSENFYIGGKPAENFVRIWIDHIARTLPLPEHKADWRGRALKAVAPMFTERNLNWELHVDETPRDLWLIQGLVPPLPNTEPEKKWHLENKPTPYQPETAINT